MQYGFAGIINAAETSLIQGIDLYAEEDERLRAMLEFHARYLNGASVPGSLCGGTLTDSSPSPIWELALNGSLRRSSPNAPGHARKRRTGRRTRLLFRARAELDLTVA